MTCARGCSAVSRCVNRTASPAPAPFDRMHRRHRLQSAESSVADLPESVAISARQRLARGAHHSRKVFPARDNGIIPGHFAGTAVIQRPLPLCSEAATPSRDVICRIRSAKPSDLICWRDDGTNLSRNSVCDQPQTADERDDRGGAATPCPRRWSSVPRPIFLQPTQDPPSDIRPAAHRRAHQILQATETSLALVPELLKTPATPRTA